MSAPTEKAATVDRFAFDEANRAKIEAILAKYPQNRPASAVLPLLDLAQRQVGGWLPRAAMDHVAELLSMPPIKVYEVATFYTMFNLKPVGEHFVQLCTTTPCWLRGSDEMVRACKQTLGVGPGETTEDGKFTVVEVECLGACVNAPMVQINDDYYEDLDFERMTGLLEKLKRGESIPPGSQAGRSCGAPQSGPKTLLAAGSKEEKA